jgi:RNA polymerase sigma-70 factor (ECF subfamily)
MVHASMSEPSQTASFSGAVPDAVALPFDAFFAKHRDRLYGAMCLVTRDRGEAEDIAQEAFVKILEHWDRVGSLDDPEAYLYRTAMNAFRSRYRRSVVAAKRTFRVGPPPDPIDAVDVHDEAIRALATLTDRQRAAVVLTDLLGYSSEEAARMLGVGPSTVRAHASHGRAALRQTLRGER